MEHNFHPFHELFKQLGLECAPAAIEAFLRMHAPIPPGVTLPDASFWSPAQAAFLRDALAADSDWAEVVDALHAALRRESV
jgi:hypothetical protein